MTEPIKFQLTLQYNEFTRKVSFQVKGPGSSDYHVQLSEPLAKIFGFQQMFLTNLVFLKKIELQI